MTRAVLRIAGGIVLTMWIAAEAYAVPATITLIARESRPLGSTDAVSCVHFASHEAERTISTGTLLAPYDELTCRQPNISIEVADARSRVRLSGRFRAILVTSSPDPLTIVLLGGTADVIADGPTSLAAGPVILGSTGTIYGARLGEEGWEGVSMAVVYEGEITCQAGGGPVSIPAGSSATLTPSERPRLGALPDSDIVATASRMARVDVAKAIAAGTDANLAFANRDSLSARYADVLRRPTDAGARTNLGLTQMALYLPGEALHHLDRAAVATAPQDTILHLVIAAAQSAALAQLGQSQRAMVLQSEARQRWGSAEAVKPVAVGRHLNFVPDDSIAFRDGEQFWRKLGADSSHRAILFFEGRARGDSANATDFFRLAIARKQAGMFDAAGVAAAYALSRDSAQQVLSDSDRHNAATIVKRVPAANLKRWLSPRGEK